MINKNQIIEVLLKYGASPIESDHITDNVEMFDQAIQGLLENFKCDLHAEWQEKQRYEGRHWEE